MKRGYVHSLKSCILKNSDASQLLCKRLSVIVLLQVHSSYIITTFLYLYFIYFFIFKFLHITPSINITSQCYLPCCSQGRHTELLEGSKRRPLPYALSILSNYCMIKFCHFLVSLVMLSTWFSWEWSFVVGRSRIAIKSRLLCKWSLVCQRFTMRRLASQSLTSCFWAKSKTSRLKKKPPKHNRKFKILRFLLW